MSRRISVILILGAALAAEDVRAPPIFFRTPDPESQREIEKLISAKGLGSSTRQERTKARAGLFRIGRWAVPPLMEAVDKKKGALVPRNAALTLARILDPQCIDVLRAAAARHRNKEVRRPACLALGIFGEDKPGSIQLLGNLLRDRDPNKKHQPTAALALGKIPHRESTAILTGRLANLPKDKHIAAGIVLAATIRTPEVELPRFLGHDERLVRKTAAVCLMIRPLGSGQAKLLLDILRKPEKDQKLRAAHYGALGAMPRTKEIRERLLRCATRSTEDKDARVAALVALAHEWNVRENFTPLRRAWGKVSGRNDPVAAALLFAMIRSGEPDAVDVLLRVVKQGSDIMRFYAAGSLLHFAFLTRTDAIQERQQEILDAVANLKGRDPGLAQLEQLKGAVAYESDLSERAATARDHFGDIRGRYSLHLWDWTHEDRAWAAVNDLVYEILELDDIADRGDVFDRAEDGPLKGEKVGRPVSGTPDEQDMVDFLREEPYYGPEDLGGR